MILPGSAVVARGILRGLRSVETQVQPCGVDLSLKRVRIWTSPGTIDFDNTHRKTAATKEVPFNNDQLHLTPGSYLVDFNEIGHCPNDIAGQIFVRSTLWRSGALLSAGVMDPGYTGAIGGMLQIGNPHGLVLFRDAKLAQFVFHQLSETVDSSYSGVYQGSEAV